MKSDAIIALKKKLLLLKINSVVLDENKKNEKRVIKNAIASIMAGITPPEVK